VKQCLPAMEGLRRKNIGTALNYNAEADSNESEAAASLVDLELARYQEIERALVVQGDFENRMCEEGWAKGSSAFALKIVSHQQQQLCLEVSGI
jgi:hypothetical protein